MAMISMVNEGVHMNVEILDGWIYKKVSSLVQQQWMSLSMSTLDLEVIP